LVNQGWNPAFDDRIQNLQNQINSLQQKIIELEHNQTLTIKKSLSELLKPSQASKIDQ
jgi:TolA-binding protein